MNALNRQNTQRLYNSQSQEVMYTKQETNGNQLASYLLVFL